MNISRVWPLRGLFGASIAMLALTMSGCGSSHQATVFERARSVRLEIREGHFSQAEAQANEVLAQSRIGRWHFSPFATFVSYVSAPSDKEFADRLDTWVAQNPRSALVRLIRANYRYNLGWWIRGDGFVSGIDTSNFDRFHHELDLAAQDIGAVVRMAPGNPYARYLALLIARDTQGDTAQEAVFSQAIARFPDYYPLYSARLSRLRPRWGGSTDAMKAFTKRYVGAAPTGSALKMLHLSLYADLLGAASLECSQDRGSDGQAGCVERVMRRTADPEVTQAARAAIQTFAKRNDAEAVREVEASLRTMVTTPGGEMFATRFLQSAADALHSDTQLVTDDAQHNDYVIDRVASYVWYWQGNVANALVWDKRAIGDLADTPFASKADANDARAEIYRDLVSMYAQLGDYQQAADYGGKAAELSGGFGAAPGFDRLSCEALFRLKRYPQALKACSDIIDASEDLQAHFFRARVYEANKRNKDAIDDYKVVADSQADSAFRIYSALAISIIYDRENRFQEGLDSLNGYGSLFRANQAAPSDLAIYFNNRCYNKMKLGRSKAALDDCNTSLHYGNIPDALSKQQRLKRQLGMPL